LELYDVVLECWNAEPAERPSFTEIQVIIEVLNESLFFGIIGGIHSLQSYIGRVRKPTNAAPPSPNLEEIKLSGISQETQRRFTAASPSRGSVSRNLLRSGSQRESCFWKLMTTPLLICIVKLRLAKLPEPKVVLVRRLGQSRGCIEVIEPADIDQLKEQGRAFWEYLVF